MDNVSYRNNRPAQRPEQSQPPQQPPVHNVPSQRPAPRAQGGNSKRKFALIAAVLLIVLAVLGAYFLTNRSASTASAIDTNKYQAVFFTNGQVYFGKLSPVNDDYMRLKNVYYLQNKTDAADESSPQAASKQDASNVELIKLGNEIHGPEDEMVIAKEQVLFFENLKPAGTVSQTITNFQKNK